MKLDFLPSLQESAIFKVCATLWNCWVDRCCVMYGKDTGPHNEPRRVWLTIEAEIKAKIPELGLPTSLEKEVARFVKPLGGEILKWCKFHCPDGYLDVNIGMPKVFCWTSQGTIDMKKTAEGLVRDENLSRATRYRLACFYCLESDILELCLGCKHNSRERNRQAVERELVAFWNSVVAEDDVPPEYRDYVRAFLNAAHWCNIEAVKYFWGKLTPTEQDQSAIYAIKRVLPKYSRTFVSFPKEFSTKVLCYLLSQLNAEQQIDLVKEQSSDIALWFVSWPYQSVILEILNLVSDSLSPSACHCLLIEIADRVSHEYFDYPGLLTKVWEKVSHCCKQEVLRKYAERLMMELLTIKDFENIRLLLEDVDPGEKEFFLYISLMNCFRMNRNNCELFEQFIRELIPLKKDKIKFKKKFEKLKLPGARELFVNLLDSLIHEHDKRKCAEGNYGNSCKKCTQGQAVHNA